MVTAIPPNPYIGSIGRCRNPLFTNIPFVIPKKTVADFTLIRKICSHFLYF